MAIPVTVGAKGDQISFSGISETAPRRLVMDLEMDE